MLSLISLFQIIAVIFDPKSFLRITASTANVVAVNLDDIKILLANDLSVFLIKNKPVFSNGPRDLPRNHFDCIF